MAIGERKEFVADRNILISSDKWGKRLMSRSVLNRRGHSLSEERAVKDVLFAPER